MFITYHSRYCCGQAIISTTFILLQKKNSIHSEIVDLDIIMTAEIKNSNLSENEIAENGKGNRNTTQWAKNGKIVQ